MNNGLSHTVNKIFGLIFGALVVGFTSYNTWLLLYHTSGNAIVATLGLILFEGGMLYWLNTFTTTANGLPQMAVSLVVFVLCLVMVAIGNAIELGAVKLSADSLLANRLVVVAALIHLIAKTVFPLLSPDTSQRIANRVIEGRIVSLAQAALSDKAELIAGRVADTLATQWQADMLTAMSNHSGVMLSSADNVTVVDEDEDEDEGAPPYRTDVSYMATSSDETAIKRCITCGKSLGRVANKRYCSLACKQEAYRNNRNNQP